MHMMLSCFITSWQRCCVSLPDHSIMRCWLSEHCRFAECVSHIVAMALSLFINSWPLWAVSLQYYGIMFTSLPIHSHDASFAVSDHCHAAYTVFAYHCHDACPVDETWAIILSLFSSLSLPWCVYGMQRSLQCCIVVLSDHGHDA